MPAPVQVRKRPLGATGLEISEIVFGAGAVGGGVFRGSEEERREVVRRALSAGISWIDTAPSYGNGASEENLGRILRELGAEPQVSTKVRVRAGAGRDECRAVIRASVEESLRRLQRELVDLVQLHNPVGLEADAAAGRVGVDDVLGPGGIADALDEVCQAGLASFTGFTALGEVDALFALVRSGRFATAQVYHNLLNPSASQPVPPRFDALDYRELAVEAAGVGMGVLNIRVLAAGIVAGQEPRGRAMSPGSEPGRDAERVRAVDAALAGEPGTAAQRAIRFALGQPGISAVLVGFSNAAQVDEAVAAVLLPPFSPAARSRLELLYRTGFRAL